MNAEIVNRQDAQVLGIIVRINPSEADYDDLWHRRFDPREPEVNRLAIDRATSPSTMAPANPTSWISSPA